MFLKYDEFTGAALCGMGPGRYKSNVQYRMHYLKYNELFCHWCAISPGSYKSNVWNRMHYLKYDEMPANGFSALGNKYDNVAAPRGHQTYARYHEQISIDLRPNNDYRREGAKRPLNDKFEYYVGYSASCVAIDPTAKIQDYPCERRTSGKKIIPGSVADCICDTREHLENWKHYIFHNKLPLFLNIVMTYSQSNNVKNFMPYLVDKHYTDEEIAEMFGFTSDELEFIDYILYKYERHSPWFRRYMLGEEAVTREEIKNYLHKQ